MFWLSNRLCLISRAEENMYAKQPKYLFNPIALSVAIWQRLLVTVFRRKLKKIYTRQQIQLERLFHDIKTLILKKCEIMIKYCQKISLKNSRFFMPMVPPWKKNQIAYFRRKIQRGTLGKSEFFFSKIEKLMIQLLFLG